MLTGDSLRAGSHANPPLATPQTPGPRFAWFLRWTLGRGERVEEGFEGRGDAWGWPNGCAARSFAA